MKALAAFAASLTIGSALFAQSALPGRHSLSLDVRVVSTGGAVRSEATSKANLRAVQNNAGTGKNQKAINNFSQSRDATSGVGLEVEVRNLSSSSDAARVEWFFFGEGVKKNADDYIAATNARDVTVPAAGSETLEVNSPDFVSREQKKLTISQGQRGAGHAVSTKKSGAELSGWMVRLLVDGKVAAVRASSPSFEAAGRDAEKLRAFPRKLN